MRRALCSDAARHPRVGIRKAGGPQVTPLLPGLGGHSGADSDPGAGDLPLGLESQYQHGLLVILDVVVDTPTDFRRPELDAVVLEQRRHRGVLAVVESPLVFPDHDRVPAAVWIGQRADQGGGLGAARPGQRPAVADVEETRPRCARARRPARRPGHAAAPVTSPGPASPRSRPARRRRTAGSRRPAAWSAGQYALPTRPAHSRSCRSCCFREKAQPKTCRSRFQRSTVVIACWTRWKACSSSQTAARCRQATYPSGRTRMAPASSVSRARCQLW